MSEIGFRVLAKTPEALLVVGAMVASVVATCSHANFEAENL